MCIVLAVRALYSWWVSVPHEQGLIAHSDGDVVLHAVADALLGAIAAGDIGRHFRIQIRSLKVLIAVFYCGCVCAGQNSGFQLGNLDVTIIAQAPKMAPISRLCV